MRASTGSVDVVGAAGERGGVAGAAALATTGWVDLATETAGTAGACARAVARGGSDGAAWGAVTVAGFDPARCDAAARSSLRGVAALIVASSRTGARGGAGVLATGELGAPVASASREASVAAGAGPAVRRGTSRAAARASCRSGARSGVAVGTGLAAGGRGIARCGGVVERGDAVAEGVGRRVTATG